MDIQRYRAEFAHIAEGFVHLNHAGVSGMSVRTVGRMTEAIDRAAVDPLGFFPGCLAQAIQCRERLAALMGVAPADVAFTKNTAHALSIVADGLDWSAGDEVVFADCEYPANSYPWLAQQDRGVICNVVRTRPDGSIPPEDFAAAMSRRTRVLAVSWVQFTTGYRSDLRALAELAHAHGALLVVDIIQGLGAFPLDLSNMGVDIAATGSQKWLIGPVGVGALMVRPEVLTHLRLVNVGAGSAKDVAAFDTLAFDLKPTVQRYEEGTPNLFGMCGLNAALEMLEEVGMGEVSRRILEITRYAMDRLRSRGYILDSPDDDRQRSGLVMFHHPAIASASVVDALVCAKINVVQRGGRVRFAPHFFNTHDDIDRAIAALP